MVRGLSNFFAPFASFCKKPSSTLLCFLCLLWPFPNYQFSIPIRAFCASCGNSSIVLESAPVRDRLTKERRSWNMRQRFRALSREAGYGARDFPNWYRLYVAFTHIAGASGIVEV
jgi:hypothetical protein